MSTKEELDDTNATPPRVLDAPEEIWLNYGEIERNCTHRECCASGEVTWCEDSVFQSDVRYVRADIAALESRHQLRGGGCDEFGMFGHGRFLAPAIGRAKLVPA